MFLGRKLFWLFVGIIGFLSATQIASQFFPHQSALVVLTVAILAGLLGAILAVFIQQLIVILAGFLAGAHLTARFLENLGSQSGHYFWVFFILGGIVGAILALLLLDWALIILSSLMGATLISQATHLARTQGTVLFIVLVIVGILVQSRFISRAPLTSQV